MRKPKFRRRADARPDEVLDAALELFTQQGFDRTTVDQIATRAGLSKGSVYLYFPSKKALLEGLVRRSIVPIADTALAAMTQYRGDPRPFIRQMLTMLVTQFNDPKDFAIVGILIREAVAVPEIAAMYRRDVLDKVLPAMRTLLSRAVVDGYIRPIDPDMTIRSVMGPILVHFLLAEVFEIKPEDGLSLDRLIDNHLTIFFAGLEPESDAE